MEPIIRTDNPVAVLLSRVFDLMVLNILFLLCSLPVITLGAAATAMYDVIFRLRRGEEPSVIRAFFRAMKGNFRQATVLWLGLLAGLLFFGADLYIVLRVIDPAYRLLQIPVLVMLLGLTGVGLYGFPLLTVYSDTIRRTVKNALLLSLGNLPVTIFFLAVPALVVYLCLFSAQLAVLTFSLVLFMGCAALASLYAIFLQRIFDRAGA